jgi:hypothetical protein
MLLAGNALTVTGDLVYKIDNWVSIMVMQLRAKADSSDHSNSAAVTSHTSSPISIVRVLQLHSSTAASGSSLLMHLCYTVDACYTVASAYPTSHVCMELLPRPTCMYVLVT